jgi:hypothetical protein
MEEEEAKECGGERPKIAEAFFEPQDHRQTRLNEIQQLT